jgi:chaperonin GroEL (HSP60 family)
VAVFLQEEILLAVEKSKVILRNFLDNDLFLGLDKSKLLVKTFLQSFDSLKTSDKEVNSIIEIVISNALEAEKISPGGLKKTLEKWLELDKIENQQIECFSPTIEDLKQVISNSCDDKMLSSIIFEAINLAGIDGKISIEKSSNNLASIELIEDYQFDCSYQGSSSIKILSPKIICIDGYVSTVSEINLLLESLVSTGHQLVIIAKGFDDDVINTIKINNARKIFSVFLVTIPFVLENINSIADISTVVGCIPISSHLGQLISTASVDNAVVIDEIKISPKRIFIKNKKTKVGVFLHVENLKKKLKDDNVKDLYEKRIKSLNCHNVIVRLPDDKNFVKFSQSIDFSLRSIKSMIEFGVSETKELAATKISSDIFSKKIDQTLKNLGTIMMF